MQHSIVGYHPGKIGMLRLIVSVKWLGNVSECHTGRCLETNDTILYRYPTESGGSRRDGRRHA